MNINNMREWVDLLVKEKKLKEMQGREIGWRLDRLSDADQLDVEITLSSLVHEIHNKIAPKIETFKDLYEQNRAGNLRTTLSGQRRKDTRRGKKD